MNTITVFGLLAAALIGIGVFVNPLLGLLTWYVNKRIRMNVNGPQRDRLLIKLQSKLDSMDKRIEEEKNDDKRETLLRIKNTLRYNIAKLEHIRSS